MTKLDRQRMLDSAVSFFLAGERCMAELEFGVYPSHRVDAPTIVNYSLSLEIVLKLLLDVNDVPAEKWKGQHSLLKLYNLQIESVRNDIESACKNSAGEFKIIENAFIKWRYSYESEYLICSPTSMRNLFIACHKALQAISPDMKSIYEKNWEKFEPDPTWAWYEKENRYDRKIGHIKAVDLAGILGCPPSGESLSIQGIEQAIGDAIVNDFKKDSNAP